MHQVFSSLYQLKTELNTDYYQDTDITVLTEYSQTIAIFQMRQFFLN